MDSSKSVGNVRWFHHTLVVWLLSFLVTLLVSTWRTERVRITYWVRGRWTKLTSSLSCLQIQVQPQSSAVRGTHPQMTCPCQVENWLSVHFNLVISLCHFLRLNRVLLTQKASCCLLTLSMWFLGSQKFCRENYFSISLEGIHLFWGSVNHCFVGFPRNGYYGEKWSQIINFFIAASKYVTGTRKEDFILPHGFGVLVNYRGEHTQQSGLVWDVGRMD